MYYVGALDSIKSTDLNSIRIINSHRSRVSTQLSKLHLKNDCMEFNVPEVEV